MLSSQELTTAKKKQIHTTGIKPLSNSHYKISEHFDELSLLSKRKARAILRIGNDALNSLIMNGELKIVRINKNDKIPYVSLQEFVFKMSSKSVDLVDNSEYLSEEEYVAKANNIIQNILKGNK